MKRIRFRVPEAELLHARAFMLNQNFTLRTWAEVMLTYLCCPGGVHPAVAHCGVTFEALRKGLILPGSTDTDTTYYDFRWPESLVAAVDPACQAAELSFQGLLSLTWAWLHSPDLTINVNLAARLAAFGRSITQPTSWGEVRAAYHGTDVNANPHALAIPTDYDIKVLPWNVRIKGVTL